MKIYRRNKTAKTLILGRFGRFYGTYFSDGTEYDKGDSVMILYKKKEHVLGIVTDIRYFNNRPTAYFIHNMYVWYPSKRMRGIRMVLTEKSIIK
jgi:hypothetical protein